MSTPDSIDSSPVFAQLITRWQSVSTWGATSTTTIPRSDRATLLPISGDPNFSHEGTVICRKCGQLITIRYIHQPDLAPFHEAQRRDVKEAKLKLLFSVIAAGWSWVSLGLGQPALGIPGVTFLAGIFFTFAMVSAAIHLLDPIAPPGRRAVCDPPTTPYPLLSLNHYYCSHTADSWFDENYPGMLEASPPWAGKD